MDAANRFLADDYLPRHDAFLPRPPSDAGSAFAPFAGPHEDILCVPEERLVGNHDIVHRTDDVVFIHVTAGKWRDAATKKALFKRLAQRLAESPGLRPEDVQPR